MSVSTQAGHTRHCDRCEETFNTINSPWEEHCSDVCYFSSKGNNVLTHIHQDHRWCSTCFKPIRVVFRPAPGECQALRDKAVLIRESFIGFQDLTEYAESGDYGIECNCGNIDHYHEEPILRNAEPYERFLQLVFSKLKDEGQIENDFDMGKFLEGYYRKQDFTFAVGYGLFS